jgi:hypothetical protein
VRFGVELVTSKPKINSSWSFSFLFIIIMSAKATRAEKILTRIGDRLGITDAGKQWLIAALDIFHDNPLDCVGYPDGSVSPCVTRLQKYTVTLNANPGNTTANWDCLILDTPHPSLIKLFGAVIDGSSTTQPLNNINVTAQTSLSFGGLWCITAPANSNFDGASIVAGIAAGTYAIFPLTIDPSLTQGDFRIIAKGFEVYNVTNQLSRGGTVTVFESPLNSFTTAQNYGIFNTGASTSGGGQILVNPQWPQNGSSAYALTNSKQWEAEKGCYVMGRLLQTDLPIENGLNFTNPFYYFGQSLTAPIVGLSATPQNDTNSHGAMPASLWEMFNFTGAFFQGLANASALTVDYMVYLENHPAFSDTAIYSLAKPPPCRDDIALSMYTCIMREMPVGVPVSENGLGDWFADAISNVADYVSPVLSAIPHPMTQAVGMGLRAAGNVAAYNKGYPTNARGNVNQGLVPVSGGGAASKAATKLRNAEIRARNEEIRARKAAKAAGKG